MITLLLLPGLDGTGTLFGEFIAALPPHIAPVAIRYPTDDALSYEELLTYIEERLPDGTFVVLGESFSGPLAIELAAKNQRVQAVILCASFVRSPVRLARWLVRPLWFRLAPRWIIAWMLFGTFRAPALHRAIAMVQPRVLASRVRGVLRVDARESLKKIRVPMMMLVGKRDRLVRQHVPEMETIELDAPHLVLQAAPAAAANAVVEFLERL